MGPLTAQPKSAPPRYTTWRTATSQRAVPFPVPPDCQPFCICASPPPTMKRASVESVSVTSFMARSSPGCIRLLAVCQIERRLESPGQLLGLVIRPEVHVKEAGAVLEPVIVNRRDV